MVNSSFENSKLIDLSCWLYVALIYIIVVQDELKQVILSIVIWHHGGVEKHFILHEQYTREGVQTIS